MKPIRITPACAGRRLELDKARRDARDHPRVCGEKFYGVRPGWHVGGSPPRVRGEDFRDVSRKRQRRITPACAGRRLHCDCALSGLWDHPRVCGEKFIMAKPRKPRDGSPPRVRGEVDVEFLGLRAVRITPACAGRSRCRISRSARCSDHPRVCGEKFFPREFISRTQGSPPRVRGED